MFAISRATFPRSTALGAVLRPAAPKTPCGALAKQASAFFSTNAFLSRTRSARVWTSQPAAYGNAGRAAAIGYYPRGRNGANQAGAAPPTPAEEQAAAKDMLALARGERMSRAKGVDAALMAELIDEA